MSLPQLTRAYAASDVAETRSLYDDWATSYDKDMAKTSQDYVGPVIASTYVLKCLGSARIDENTEILDAGCGTGLVGVHLAKVGAKKLDGIDLSPGMLDVARKAGVYRSLDTADLSKPLVHKDQSYDVVVCVGTLTQNHVGPEALVEFVRVVKQGGFVVATVLDAIWESGGYVAKVESLVKDGKVKLVSAELEDYRRGAGVRARMIVFQVLP
jgi:predicted TPR repeat methyltransferase